MQCKICGREGANNSGFHTKCFTTRVSQKEGTHSKTAFSGSGVKYQTTDQPSTEEDWLNQKSFHEQKRKLQEEAEEAEEAERRRKDEEWNAQQRRQTYQTYSDFFNSGFKFWPGHDKTEQKTTNIQISIDASKLRKLLMLCHPDKHDNSEIATEVTRWLIDIKNKLG